MKRICFIVGWTGSGKTTLSERFAKHYNGQLIHADDLYNWLGVYYNRKDYDKLTAPEEWKKYPDLDMWRRRYYGVHVNEVPELIVIEGWTSAFEESFKSIVDVVKPAYTYTLLLSPDEKKRNEYHLGKHGFIPDYNKIKAYENNVYAQNLYKIVNSDELFDTVVYQRMGFTDQKWNKLQIDVDGKSVLDLGCSSGMFSDFAYEDGCINYMGVDNSWKELEVASHRCGKFLLGKIEELDNIIGGQKFDVVISTATLHYIKDLPSVLNQVKRCTQEVFVYEALVGDFAQDEIIDGNRIVRSRRYLRSLLEESFDVKEIGESVYPTPTHKFERIIYHCKV